MPDQRERLIREATLRLAVVVAELLALTGPEALRCHGLGAPEDAQERPKLELVYSADSAEEE